MSNYTLGDKFKVVGRTGVIHGFTLGDVVEFVYDDDTDAPKFKRVSDGHTQYVSYKDLEFIEEEDTEVKEFKEGDVVECITEGLHWYGKGETYTKGYDHDRDFGALDKDGDAMIEGMDFSNFKLVTPAIPPLQTETLQTMTVDQLIGFVYGYTQAGGDLSKQVTITFEGDK